jgi:hypothetical protein
MATRLSVRTILTSIVLLGALAAPAVAFEERSVGGGSGASPALSPPASGLPNLNLSLPDAGAPKSTGTEVKIPGIGTLGVLPKLDFGLELLYGANDPPGSRLDERTQPSDVQLRATIKHRF